MPVTDAWKSACRAGNATLTTVPSINAMLEARIVAIKTQGPWQGWTAEGAALAASSWHGDLMDNIMRGLVPTYDARGAQYHAKNSVTRSGAGIAVAAEILA